MWVAVSAITRFTVRPSGGGACGPKWYDLYAVINHSGSLSRGHYTATVRADDGRWFECNDTKTRVRLFFTGLFSVSL